MKTIHVAVGVIMRNNSILIAKRKALAHMGGYWEFPGGKVEQGECVKEALHRELQEELGIECRRFYPLIRYSHQYDDREVVLDVWRVLEFYGEPVGAEGQEISWYAQDKLQQVRFLPANQAIIKACSLPSMYGISPEPTGHIDEFLESCAQAIQQHQLKFYQLRAKQMPFRHLIKVSKALLALCHARQCRLIVNTELSLLDYVDVDGIHLSQQIVRELPSQKLTRRNNSLLGVSCHNEQEIIKAMQLGADYITLSPVAHTGSHPDQQPLGWSRFKRLVERSTVPVYALGGLNASDLTAAEERGAIGVAGVSAFTSTRY